MKTFTPHTISPAACARIDQIRAEAEEEGMLMLLPMGRLSSFDSEFLWNSDVFRAFDAHGSCLSMTRRRAYRSRETKNPLLWSVDITRIDAHGRRWSCFLGDHVTDDFGTLVLVQE